MNHNPRLRINIDIDNQITVLAILISFFPAYAHAHSASGFIATAIYSTLLTLVVAIIVSIYTWKILIKNQVIIVKIVMTIFMFIRSFLFTAMCSSRIFAKILGVI